MTGRQPKGIALRQAMIIAAGVLLLALTWVAAFSAINAERRQAAARVATSMANETLAFQEQVGQQFRVLDQTLRILQDEWRNDPAQFDLQTWRSRAIALNELADEVFVADEKGIVRQTTLAQSLGRDISGRNYFRQAAGRPVDDDKLLLGMTRRGEADGKWRMDVVRPLRRRDGSFGGVVGVAYPLSAFSKFYSQANLGSRGMVALVDLDQGRLRALSGPDAPPDASVNGSEMLAALKSKPNGSWIGASAPDSVPRIHAFRRLPGHNLAVVLAVDREEALRRSVAWSTGVKVIASGVSVLLLVVTGLLLYETRAARRREEASAGERANLAAANGELAEAKARADAKSAQLEATLTGMADGVAMIDGNLRLVEWNPSYPPLSGVPKEILRVGLPMEDMLRAQAAGGEFGELDVEAEVARRMTLLRSGSHSRVVERVRPDGRTVELRRSPLPDGGFVTLFTDITTRKEAENALHDARMLAEAATEAKSRFVAIVSHEIRTPLNALLNSLTLLAGSDLTRPQQILLDMARQSGDALLGLINDILEMSKMEAGQLQLRLSLFDLRALLETVVEMLRAQATERGITLRLSIAAGVPTELYSDPGRLRQVMLNLLSNAAKYALSGEVVLAVDTRMVGGRTMLRLAVRDPGPAIEPELRARLFQPFSQLDTPTSEGQPGTGLGLAICRHLAALMGGDIGCDAIPDSGTAIPKRVGAKGGNEFWVMLPIVAAPAQGEIVREHPGVKSRYILPRTRILLVEDILANQLITATLLRREGHMVDIASNGEAAITAVTSCPYDLVFMDIFMPGMTGLEATKRIRALPGPPRMVPIIALTANVSPEDKATCRTAGMDGMLAKPTALSDLLDVIERHVWPEHGSQTRLDLVVTSRSPSPTVPILNESRLTELRRNLPPALLNMLVEECLTDMRERLPALRRALQARATEDIVATAHALSGVAAGYAMAALESRFRAVMQAARRDGPVAAAVLADDLETDLAAASVALREAVKTEMV